jgi:ABC-type uncharacterized transport system substrate-binding protein
MIHKSLILLSVVATCLLPGRAAEAHPHLWIDVVTNVMFDKGKVTGLHFQWTFDEFFSAGVIGEFDKNNNKQYDADEIEPLRAEAFEPTKEMGFFTDIRIGDKKFDIETTTDFTARIEKEIVTYEFTVPFPEPVDPIQTPITFSVYDESYFVDISFLGHEPIKLIGDGGDTCSVKITEDRSNPIYGGVVYPKVVALRCTP